MAVLDRGLANAAAARAYRRRRLLQAVPALISALILAVIVVAAVVPSSLAPGDPNQQNLREALQPPSWLPGSTSQHLMGTDALGRDIWTRMIHGSRVSLAVSLAAVAIQGTLGVGLGLLAGYYRGRIDTVIMRLADVQLAIPFLALAMAVVAVLGPGLVNLVIVLGITGWVVYARVVRAEVLALRERDYVQAARALGSPDARVILRHVLPNVLASVTVIATLQVAQMIITDSALSFLGLGVQPPQVSWGYMVAEGRRYLATHWWVAACPGAAIFVTVLAINLLGDWLGDRMDPTLRI